MENQENAIIDDKSVYGNTTKAVPVPEPNIGLEDKHSVVNDLLSVSEQSQINTSVINSFLDVSKRRDLQYDAIDQMCDDSIPAAILELHTEDSTASNEDNNVVWVTSDDSIIQKTCAYILDSFQVNKNIYKWANSLIKYGDVYLKLFKKSEYDIDPIFGDKKLLKEDINVHINKDNDHFVNYAEMVDNPATVFELVRFGKTAGFIKTHIEDKSIYTNSATQILNNSFRYKFNQNDIDIYQENQFVHGCLEDNVDRISEEVEIIRDDTDSTDDNKETKANYKVKSGRSVFYGAFKIWRTLTLLETSLILSRLTKSSITRVVQVEVGNIDKTEVKPILQSVKQMIEQKIAVNPGVGMGEYNNPGPVENNVYVPTKDGKGAITTSQIGGDYDPKALTDLDYFNNKFFGYFGTPKQYFGYTDDGAGFNGGTALTIISSKYAKKVIKIQTALTEMLTTLVNIILIDRGLSKYINKFIIHMTKPVTQEDIDRTEARANAFRDVSDTLTLFDSTIESKESKLRILKALLPQVTTNPEILEVLDEEIAKARTEEPTGATPSRERGEESTREIDDNEPLDLDNALDLGPEFEEETTEETNTEEETPTLPTPGETGVDLLNMTGEEEI